MASVGDKLMTDRRTTFALAVFFAVALINPRDFPIDNIPLIYPAFALYWMLMGTSAMVEGFRRVKFLFVLLVAYQTYFTVLRVIFGATLQPLDLAYLVEPPMVLIGAAAGAVKAQSTRTATWVFVSVIAFSAASGVGIYTVGEPFTTVRSTIQHSIGGTLATGSDVRAQDFETTEDLTALLSLNAGLSSDVISFGYQVAAAILLVMVAMLSKNPTSGRSYAFLVLMLAVLLAGAITNTERATVTSVLGGLAVFLLTGLKRHLLTPRSIALIVVGVGTVYGLAAASETWDERESLVKRMAAEETSSETLATRMYMSIPAAMTVFYQPFGAGDISEHYTDVAFAKGWLRTRNGVIEAHSPHNHFAGIIMFCGIVGVTVTLLLFGGLFSRLASLRRGRGSLYARMLGAACAGQVFHSCLHNAGFFGLVPSTLIVFGLFWGETSAAVVSRPMTARKRPVMVVADR